MRVAITYVAILSSAILISFASASIEKEPVKVTHKNSGPKYDFDDVERTRLTPQADNTAENSIFPPRAQNPFVTPEAATNGDPQSSGDVAPTPIGHISIRRIFLVPMTAPQTDGGMWSSSQSVHPLGASGDRSSPSDDESSGSQEQPRLFGAGPSRPFWPFMGPPRPHHHHLLGGDEASRSPTPDSSMERPLQVERPEQGEREEPEQGVRMMIDPIQMMMEMLQHALNPQLATTGSGTSLFKDLNKEASGNPSSNGNDDNRKPSSDPAMGLERPQPSMRNETKEDVVEIDGKKFLRKTVINRHVGENIIFMTKRLIFVPLNETNTTNNDEPSSATTTTTIAPTTNNVASTEVPVPSSTINPQEATTTAGAGEPKVEAAITSTNPPTTEAPTTVAAGNSDSSTTTSPSTTTSGSSGDNAAEETTTRGETIMEKVSDAISRAVERLEERAGSTTTTAVVSP